MGPSERGPLARASVTASAADRGGWGPRPPRLGRRTSLALALLAAPFSACDCATEAVSPEDVLIASFDVESSEPPAREGDGALVVARGASVTLAWELDGPAKRIALAAGDELLFEGPAAPSGRFVDRCAEGEPCGTDEVGEVLYTLTVVGEGVDGRDLRGDSRTLDLRVEEP